MSIPSFKLVVIGGESVGKTSLLDRFQKKSFKENVQASQAVVNFDQKVKLQQFDQNIQLEVYDVPGADRFMVLNRMYLRDTNAALIVYDVNSTESLKQAQVWVDELKEYAPSETVISLTGNKMDIAGAHAVGQQDGQNFARKHQIPICKEVSAKTGENIDTLFQTIANQCYENRAKFVSGILLHFDSNIRLAFENEKHFQTCKSRCRSSLEHEEERMLMLNLQFV